MTGSRAGALVGCGAEPREEKFAIFSENFGLLYSQCESMEEARRIEPGFYLKPLGLWAEASFLNVKFS